MNIKQAKQEITNTLRAYLAKDALGNYRIASVRQRPVLLMGPPGIGKTQIMEQIAAETGVALVSYTITHHTRQSAIGLPIIEQQRFGEREYAVTEYTMSEILSSVYQTMEKTGLREGILFLDEINCVSETLAPMMLQFLQCKTFGNQRLPEGWMIVASGNPPEYNKSVRDFDMVTLDRVKHIRVEEDYAVWKEYAVKKGLNGAILSYLDLKKENFYRVETTADGLQFATARGWEDLSELLFAYQALGISVNRTVVEQYLQHPGIARDFADYLELYEKYQRIYHVDGILSGSWQSVTVSQLRSAPFDEKLSVMSLLLSRLREDCGRTRMQDLLCDRLLVHLRSLKAEWEREPAQLLLTRSLERCREGMQKQKDAGRLERETRDLSQRVIQWLERCRSQVLQQEEAAAQSFASVKALFEQEVAQRQSIAEQTKEKMESAFRFLEETFSQGQELVIFVTEISAGYDTSWFVENFGCDAYFRHNRELLFDETRHRIREEIEGLQ